MDRDHIICARIHAKRRAKERFGIDMGKPMYRSLCFSIKDNKQIQVRRLTASVRLVKVREIPNCLAVYSRRHNTIITFLREDEYHERRNQQLREAAEGSGFNLESWLEQFDGDQGL